MRRLLSLGVLALLVIFGGIFIGSHLSSSDAASPNTLQTSAAAPTATATVMPGTTATPVPVVTPTATPSSTVQPGTQHAGNTPAATSTPVPATPTPIPGPHQCDHLDASDGLMPTGTARGNVPTRRQRRDPEHQSQHRHGTRDGHRRARPMPAATWQLRHDVGRLCLLDR